MGGHPTSFASWTPYTLGGGHATYKGTEFASAITLASTPTSGVTLPSDAVIAVLSVKAAAVWILDDGGTPDPADDVGVRYPPGLWIFEGREQLVAMSIARETASSVLLVGYWKKRS